MHVLEALAEKAAKLALGLGLELFNQVLAKALLVDDADLVELEAGAVANDLHDGVVVAACIYLFIYLFKEGEKEKRNPSSVSDNQFS